MINRFNGDGIRLETGGNNTIAGNFIGTDPTGITALGNRGDGVSIDGSSDNTIGGTTAEARNVISGNGVPFSDGIHIASSTATATGNKVQGNYIDTDKSGIVALGNGNDGVEVQNGTNNTTIGGEVAGAGNVISGNGNWGVALRAGANAVQGNRIGTDKSGIANLGNGSSIIFVSSSNTIGGATSNAGNTIAFNSQDGIVGLSGTGNRILSNSIFSNGVFTSLPGVWGSN